MTAAGVLNAAISGLCTGAGIAGVLVWLDRRDRKRRPR